MRDKIKRAVEELVQRLASIDSEEYLETEKAINEIAEKHQISPWMLAMAYDIKGAYK